MIAAPTTHTQLQLAFRWITARRKALPMTAISGLLVDALAAYTLTTAEAQWLTWTFDPNAVSIAPKEPDGRTA